MNLRYFEIHDLLCEALIALEAGDHAVVAAKLQRALAWTEGEWLATPSTLSASAEASLPAPAGPDDEDDP
ncbi:MAG: hypothetical protein HYV62_09760 [Candidatus Rokubacteria bacterium]|nr:hypothetical protein [Candidatus Rokubacteria bacterium]